MPRIEVPFIVDKQIITQSPTVKLVGGGQNYFYATFKICDVWKKVSGIKVVFSRENIVKVITLSKGDDCWECEIPWEVIAEKGIFYVGIFGDDMLLTDTAYVEVLEGCLTEGEEPLEPTPDWFSTMEKKMEDKVDKEDGKGLSTNDFDDEYKDKVDNLIRDNEKLQQQMEESKAYVTDSSNTPIYDVNIKAENKGIEGIKFYGAVSQETGATLANPKTITYPTTVNTFYVCGVRTELNAYITNSPFLATNKYKDEGWYDFNTKALHFKNRIKKIVLNGTERWFKVSALNGRYFVNLHTIDGAFTSEDLDRISNGTPIAYGDDALCSSGTYHNVSNGNPTQSGQFWLSQDVGNSGGFFRAYFYAPEFDTLDEVLAQVKKNPITLLMPMIYDVKEYTIPNRIEVLNAINSRAKNPFSLYFYGAGFGELDTEVTYQVDVGLCLQNLKNAINKLSEK